MRRVVVIAPGLIGPVEDESPLRQKLPSLSILSETGRLFKLAALPAIETPETLFLGMRADEAQMRQGPLTVSALGADPPDRSTHFHLSLMSFDGASVGAPEYLPSPQELETLMERAKRLNTSTLTQVLGEGLDHGLVWEGRGDLGTTSETEAVGKPIRTVLPEGDAERILRRLIDDSINLLSELELNERRIDEGLPPINLLWPWGHGERRPVPNLVLRRGEPATVESSSLRLSGLTRLTGYTHGNRNAVGSGVKTRFAALAQRALSREVSLIVLDGFDEMRREGKFEELHWLAPEFDRELLKPLLDASLKDAIRITILAPGSDGLLGLGVSTTARSPIENIYPFDERSLQERLVPTRDLWQEVESGLVL